MLILRTGHVALSKLRFKIPCRVIKKPLNINTHRGTSFAVFPSLLLQDGSHKDKSYIGNNLKMIAGDGCTFISYTGTDLFCPFAKD